MDPGTAQWLVRQWQGAEQEEKGVKERAVNTHNTLGEGQTTNEFKELPLILNVNNNIFRDMFPPISSY